jgi:hypothetical protein
VLPARAGDWSVHRLADVTVPLRWRVPLTVLFVLIAAVGVVVGAVAATPIIDAAAAPVDFDIFGPIGADILTGHWTSVFDDPVVQAGVFELVFWGIPALLGVTGTLGWTIFTIITTTLLAVAAAAVFERMLRQVAPVWSVPLGVGAAAFAALTGVFTTAIFWGHPAQIAVALMWIIGAQLARDDKPLLAGAVIAATAGWEVWGLLGVPLLLLLPRIDARAVLRAGIAGVAVVAVLFVPFALLGPFAMFDFQWTVRPSSLTHFLDPGATTFPWPLRLVQGMLTLAAGVTTALLMRRKIDGLWLPMAMTSAVRLALDPALINYYGVAPELLMLLGLAIAIPRRAVLLALGCLVGVNLIIDIAPTFITVGVLVVLLAGLVMVAWRSDRPRHPVT